MMKPLCLILEDEHLLTLDVSELSPEEATQKILAYAEGIAVP